MISAAEFKRLQAEIEALREVARAAVQVYETWPLSDGSHTRAMLAMHEALEALPPRAESEGQPAMKLSECHVCGQAITDPDTEGLVAAYQGTYRGTAENLAARALQQPLDNKAEIEALRKVAKAARRATNAEFRWRNSNAGNDNELWFAWQNALAAEREALAALSQPAESKGPTP